MNAPRVLEVGEEPPPMDSPAAPDRGTEAPTGTKRSAADRRLARDRFAVLNTFVDTAMAGLSGAEIAVWLVLYRDTRDGTARTGQDDIARRVGCNVRTVRRALASLQRAGLVRLVRRGGVNRGASRYRLRGSPPGE